MQDALGKIIGIKVEWKGGRSSQSENGICKDEKKLFDYHLDLRSTWKGSVSRWERSKSNFKKSEYLNNLFTN
jgi:hypothetical protein